MGLRRLTLICVPNFGVHIAGLHRPEPDRAGVLVSTPPFRAMQPLPL